MKTRLWIRGAAAVIFAFLPFSRALAEEAPLPVLAAAPVLPSLQTFGASNPPGAVKDAGGLMPDVTFWSSKPEKHAEEKMAQNIPKRVEKVWLPPEGSIFAWPVRGKVSSGFGLRGLGDRKRMHEGIDIPVPEGTPIQASAAGVVFQAQEINGYGKTVVLDHGKGMKTLYAHCSELLVKHGERVEGGQVIAYAGDTGRATTAHVHFGVLVENVFRDPAALLTEQPQSLARKP